ncbi:MAG: 3-isopropylmalate dehydratase large subunit [Firmicutes bacterium]|jgi:3-isopropylmalate/(R)-2-methylmalate dehydratase large subunit|nr:3-isopropylmalate dehydratase large subunit [Bacillota bacterium]
MGLTMIEKILARGAGKSHVRPGDIVRVKIDMCLGNDITAPVAINEFERMEASRVFDPERIALVPDHFAPNKDIASAQQCQRMRDFARKHQIKHYFEIGRMGVEHALLPEKGLALPGEIIIGADSHTCTYGAMGAFATGVGSTDLAAGMALGEAWFKVPPTLKFVYRGKPGKWIGGKDLILYTIGKIGVDGALYKAMEFSGEAIDELSLEGRLTMTNMAIEAGAKCGYMEPDEKVLSYARERAARHYEPIYGDADAIYEQTSIFDIGELEPQVAFPHLPSNVYPVTEAGDIKIDQVVIGSCTNGRIEDMRQAASILKGRRADPSVRLIIIPATQEVYARSLQEGLIDIFISAEAAISTPTCGPCLGGHMGILAPGEKALATTNRNFVGRMGHPTSEVYLCSPLVAASSAITGRITHPQEVS